MKCPNCKPENPQNALRCDCGYDFVGKKIKEPDVKPEEADLYGVRHWLLVLYHDGHHQTIG
jgi:hypothetical protein